MATLEVFRASLAATCSKAKTCEPTGGRTCEVFDDRQHPGNRWADRKMSGTRLYGADPLQHLFVGATQFQVFIVIFERLLIINKVIVIDYAEVDVRVGQIGASLFASSSSRTASSKRRRCLYISPRLQCATALPGSMVMAVLRASADLAYRPAS